MFTKKILPYCLAGISFVGIYNLSAKLEFDQTQIQDVVTPEAKSYPFRFPFENKGASPVEITEIKTSCGCTVASLEKRVYQPGEKGEIKGSFNIGPAGEASQYGEGSDR